MQSNLTCSNVLKVIQSTNYNYRIIFLQNKFFIDKEGSYSQIYSVFKINHSDQSDWSELLVKLWLLIYRI